MSRSRKVKPRFNDPKDIAYLSFFGAGDQMMKLQAVKMQRKPFMLPETYARLLEPTEFSVPYRSVGKGAVPSRQGLHVAIEAVPEALVPIEKVIRKAGFKGEVKEIPSSSGAIDFEILLEKNEDGVYAIVRG